MGFKIPALGLCTLCASRVYVTGVPRVGDQALRVFSLGFLFRSLVLESVFIYFSYFLCQNSQQKQLKEGKAYFGSQFEDAVHYGGIYMGTGNERGDWS